MCIRDRRSRYADELINPPGKLLICVSATPAEYELGIASQVAEQIIRPTGLMDPPVEVRPVNGQVDDLLSQVREQTAKGYRTLVTTLTKRMAESLTEYLDLSLIHISCGSNTWALPARLP